jgi:heme/copper-type cytochrome/quinol oxidase subunit 2
MREWLWLALTIFIVAALTWLAYKIYKLINPPDNELSSAEIAHKIDDVAGVQGAANTVQQNFLDLLNFKAAQ